MERISRKKLTKYRNRFSRAKFRQKISTLPRRAGRQILDDALTLYVLLNESDTPWWVKASIAATLGYFICPVDCVPDFLPAGLLDDLALMGLMLAELHIFVTPEVRQRVNELRPVR